MTCPAWACGPAPLPVQFPPKAYSGRGQVMPSTWAPAIHVADWGSWLLASTWSRPHCCGHLQIESADGNLSISVLLCGFAFQMGKRIKRIKICVLYKDLGMHHPGLAPLIKHAHRAPAVSSRHCANSFMLYALILTLTLWGSHFLVQPQLVF